MKQRLLCLALALLLCLGLLSVPALAEGSQILAQPQNASVPAGMDAEFSFSLIGTGLSYQWQQIIDVFTITGRGQVYSTTDLVNSAAVLGAKSATLTLIGVTEAMSGTQYRCQVTDTYGVVVHSEVVTLTVPAAPAGTPVITREDADTTAINGECAFMVVVSGSEPLSYQWYMRPSAGANAVALIDAAGSVSGSQQNNLYLSGLTAAQNGACFYCVVHNNIGAATSREYRLTVEGAAPVITSQPTSVTVQEGQPLTIALTAAGDDLHYRWSVDNGIDTETFFDDVMNVPSFTYADEASYDFHNGLEFTCYIFSEYGEVTSQPIVVRVEKKAAPSFTDVPAAAWYRGDVLNAVRLGLVDGVAAGQYAPNRNLTIAAAIKLAACMHQRNATGKVTLQNGSGKWYDSYVAYAEANGIIRPGEWAGKYDRDATRAEFVRIFYPALPATGYVEVNRVSDDAIPDVPVSADWAGPVYVFYRAGILTGSDANGTFYPETSIKRSEVAAILSRMMDPSARKFIALPVPELGEMAGPMCWTATGDRYVFFTTREGRSAVQFGTWDFPLHATLGAGYVTSAVRSGDILHIELYYPPILNGDAADAQDLRPAYEGLDIDLSGLDNDGKVQIRRTGETDWYRYYPAGPTWQDGYDNVH